MKLSEILKNLTASLISGNEDTEISGVATDSKKVQKGDLFICYCGKSHDSHDDIAEITKKGAAAVICEK